jgi:signal peptide peptidase SppA
MNRNLTSAFYATPWALHPPKLREIEAVIRNRFFVQRGAGRPRRIKSFQDDNPPEPKAGPHNEKPYVVMGKVAVLRLSGIICQKMNLIAEFSGGTSTEIFGRRLDAAIADGDVASIVIDCDSPGGSCFGVPELHARMMEARRAKRMVAVVNPLMASAAYWICSAAHEIVLTPSGMVGSIGAYILHEDLSGMYAKIGIDPTLIYAGKFKVEGNEFEPLSAEARADIQSMVDYCYTQFVTAVARGRDSNPEAVRSGYGEGRVLTAESALSAGLVDRIATFDQVLQEENRRRDDQLFTMAKAKQQQAEAELLDA